jgi:hypothetical protein
MNFRNYSRQDKEEQRFLSFASDLVRANDILPIFYIVFIYKEVLGGERGGSGCSFFYLRQKRGNAFLILMRVIPKILHQFIEEFKISLPPCPDKESS